VRLVALSLFLVTLVIGGSVLWQRRSVRPTSPSTTAVPSVVVIPADSTLETASLTPADGQVGLGVATRQVVDQLVVFGVSADLPAVSVGESYAVWLVSTSESTTGRRVGTLTQQADQYSFDSSAPVTDGLEPFVRITRQRSTAEPIGPTVLEGAFQQ
jgi:hypothetical protein